jgi:hypothetical protein
MALRRPLADRRRRRKERSRLLKQIRNEQMVNLNSK